MAKDRPDRLSTSVSAPVMFFVAVALVVRKAVSHMTFQLGKQYRFAEKRGKV